MRPHLARWTSSPRARRAWVLLGPVALAVADTFIGDEGYTATDRVAPLAAAFVLLARLRHPVAVLVLTLPGTYLDNAWLAGLIALYTLSYLRPKPGLLVVCTLLNALAYFLPHPLTADEVSRRLAQEGWLEVLVGAPVAALALGRLHAVRHELAARLGELTASRAESDRLLAEHVLDTERARLAREMHDVVAHQVSLISLQAGALRTSTADPSARDIAATIRTLSVRTLEELRHMVGVLRAAGGGRGELTPQPRLADLDRLVADSALDITAEIDQRACAQCPEAVERAAYRIVQEALTNVRKHAPGARVDVRVRCRDAELALEVRNGPADRGADPLDLPSGGHGLVGLSERVHLLGGFFTAGATREGGFLVTATLPLRPA
ncbi:sensor histidine kinase [Streptomyces sp. NPDC059070]|uniref:sensor histidine kinase n=1 Tax=unclassified Streptomyces TaxID=2593676 RepID=UPI0034E1C8F7